MALSGVCGKGVPTGIKLCRKLAGFGTVSKLKKYRSNSEVAQNSLSNPPIPICFVLLNQTALLYGRLAWSGFGVIPVRAQFAWRLGHSKRCRIRYSGCFLAFSSCFAIRFNRPTLSFSAALLPNMPKFACKSASEVVSLGVFFRIPTPGYVDFNYIILSSCEQRQIQIVSAFYQREIGSVVLNDSQ